MDNRSCYGECCLVCNVVLYWHGGYEYVHHNEVADASAHDEEVEDLVGAEVFVACIEEGKLQCVDDAAYGVDDAAGQKPSESGRGEGVEDLGEGQYADPAHGNVQYGGEPFRAGDPECFYQDSGQCDAPYECAQAVAGSAAQYDQTYGGVGTCDEDEYHHVIDLSENPVGTLGKVQGVVGGTGSVKQDHTSDKNGQ